MAAVRLQDVAAAAGVSQATASRVLNGSSRIPGEGVADRVRAAAADLGYVANAQAQALARSSTGLIGLVVHDVADPYFSSIVRGVQNEARAAGKLVLLASTERDFDIERQSVSTFISHRADAIILAGSRQSGDLDRDLEKEFAAYRKNDGKVVVIGQPLPFGAAVEPENFVASAALAEALIGEGHRRFAIIGGPGNIRTSVDRRNGFVDALARHGLAPEIEVAGDFSRDGGFSAARRLAAALELHPGSETAPPCVFAVTDVMAIGAIAAWRSQGLRVPDDVCVAGFDDIPTLRDHFPSLTTVALSLVEIGERAVKLALDGEQDTHEYAPGTVVLRASSALTR
ncbi:LacI family transcriptional regulator [Rhodococcus sp. 15-649-1-2]|uniref:LacI family DNA-binding transcriptional regulator n=1 Tax=Nocardiaceae TaxID=85025 RepID=UPI000522E5F7|nr:MULTISPECIES: LacI family DNA-binding transcriptional regulator [Rhodococcus]OZC50932.1 LacI family transcriptional regulator [Rhodococcus sp. 06-621-2]OZD10984.1 LacI family transcriptional regulator [Rhodococcus sp. 06-156-4C]OZD14398.1 LacI family transcriptional regulator [Rhodococcus sp. 06-156-4a]OZD24960.1 LacI family transcriptional regulator [Rhodococcus sp. 06-156-3C]OZD27934.1 LacI family transcriptional regulator [Rhodococcus sp. 06-156-3b]